MKSLPIGPRILRTPTQLAGLVLLFLPVSASAQNVKTFGDWHFYHWTDELTDDISEIARTLALQTTVLTRDAALWVRCRQSVLEIFIEFDAFLDNESPVEVEWRFDTEEVVSWELEYRHRIYSSVDAAPPAAAIRV